MIENPEFGEFLYEEKQNGTMRNYFFNANFHGMDSLVIGPLMVFLVTYTPSNFG